MELLVQRIFWFQIFSLDIELQLLKVDEVQNGSPQGPFCRSSRTRAVELSWCIAPSERTTAPVAMWISVIHPS
jgi:hypothetical protein